MGDKGSFNYNTSIIFENAKIDSMEDIKGIERNILKKFEGIEELKEIEICNIKVINYQLLKEIEE